MERLSDYHRWPRAENFAKAAITLMQWRGQMSDAREAGADRDTLERLKCWTDGNTARHLLEKTADPISMSQAPWNEAAIGSREFLDVVGERSLVGRLPLAAKRPFATTTIAPGTDATAGWVAEGAEKIVTEMTLDNIVLAPRKVASLCVLTRDAINASAVDAQQMVVSALTRAVVLALDTVFASASAGSTAAPAGIFHGAPTVASSGVTPATIATDLAAMVDALADAHLALNGAAWIMSPKAYAYTRLLKVADADGTVAGFPVLTSDGAAGVVGLVASQYVIVGGDDVVVLKYSEQANVNLGGGGGTVSLWQKNMAAVRCEIWANWQTVATDSSGDPLCAVLLTGATWA